MAPTSSSDRFLVHTAVWWNPGAGVAGETGSWQTEEAVGAEVGERWSAGTLVEVWVVAGV